MAEHDGRAVKSRSESEAVEKATQLSARLVYAVTMEEGEHELSRPMSSIVFSGLAAGILIAFSFVGKALLRDGVPSTEWRGLIEPFGYSLGFLLVIVGRMQLFTENTITTVLPFLSRPSPTSAYRVGRLWVVVLAANVAGAIIAATVLAYTPIVPAELHDALRDIATEATEPPPGEGLVRGIPAGILIAGLVWMLSAGDRGESFWLILTFTWLLSAGGFTHIIVGSVEASYLLVQGLIGPRTALFGFFLPVLAGNVIGGTAVFTLLAWGQVREEVARDR